jgi:hypothetical protein
MSATFPADVFSPDFPDVWTSEPVSQSIFIPGCYIGMNFEPGVTASPETIHECGGNDWTCPVGIALELAYGEAEIENDTITYDELTWRIVDGPNELGYYHLTRTERYSATQASGYTAHVHGSELGLPTP